jgi:glycosyltransferase involved in cell wall biosynthesis
MGSIIHEPLVTVLTPVYNGEKFIEECIQSVINQSYQNWEYVIIDNKSTDSTRVIAERYAEIDCRIHVHTNDEHLPLMQNLNHSYTFISKNSKYCKVVHADDWLFTDCISKMVRQAEKYPSVGVVSSYYLRGTNVNMDGLPYPSHFIDGNIAARDFLLNEVNYYGAPSVLLLRSDLIQKRKQFYDESNQFSDVSACLDLFTESDFSFVHQVLSVLRAHNNSETALLFRERNDYKFPMLVSVIRLKELIVYGPKFLNKDQLKLKFTEKENSLYLRMALYMIKPNQKNVYRSYKSELERLGLEVRYLKLFKYLLISILKAPFRGLVNQLR